MAVQGKTIDLESRPSKRFAVGAEPVHLRAPTEKTWR
jgi:hypothetical protein